MGVAVEMIKTERPGYIVYEDEYQIAAYPLADTKTRKKPRIAPGRRFALAMYIHGLTRASRAE